MIFDKLQNASQYYGVGERLAKGLKYLQDTDFSEILPGKYEIDGKDLYVSVQSYESLPEEKCKWEAHKRYIDIQLVVDGCEKMGIVNVNKLQISKEYDAENDFMLLQGDGDYVTVGAGSFVIFFPEDAHMPCMAAGEPAKVKKVVVKVAV